VFTYILSLVVVPSLLRYKDPLAALKVGAPVPKNTPRLVVLDIKYPAPAVPPAGTAVPLKILALPALDITALEIMLPPVMLEF
jgi:hypothetical protein